MQPVKTRLQALPQAHGPDTVSGDPQSALMRLAASEESLEEPEVTQSGCTICLADCPFKTLQSRTLHGGRGRCMLTPMVCESDSTSAHTRLGRVTLASGVQ